MDHNPEYSSSLKCKILPKKNVAIGFHIHTVNIGLYKNRALLVLIDMLFYLLFIFHSCLFIQEL